MSNFQVTVEVTDVDEPPVFSETVYTFKVLEEHIVDQIGIIKASDPDRANKSIRCGTVHIPGTVCVAAWH